EDDRTESALQVQVAIPIDVDEVATLSLLDDEGVVVAPVAELARHPVDQHGRCPLEPVFRRLSLKAHGSHSSRNHQSFRVKPRFQWTWRGRVKLSRPSGPISLAFPLRSEERRVGKER